SLIHRPPLLSRYRNSRSDHTGPRLHPRVEPHNTPRLRGQARGGSPTFVTRDTVLGVTFATDPLMDWTLITYKLPAEPSRHRVAVWRELRKVGAVALQQGAWALPARRDFADAISRVLGLVEAAGGEALVFDASPRGDEMTARLERAFNADREDEWE